MGNSLMVLSKKNNNQTNNIKCQVLHYLGENSENLKSIAFYGKGGEGKSTLMNQMKEELKNYGYENFCEGIPEHLGIDTRKTKRTNKWVLCTNNKVVLNDTRFRVFDFTI